MAAGDRAEFFDESGGVGERGRFEHETLEILVVVLFLAIMMGWALGEIVLGARLQAQRNDGIDPAVAGDDAITEERPIVVFVHAEWCASCRRAAPAVAWLRDEYAGRVSFLDLDVTDEDAASQSAMKASRLGLGPFFVANQGLTGVTILGKDRRPVRRFGAENRPAPYRSALEEALASFKGK